MRVVFGGAVAVGAALAVASLANEAIVGAALALLLLQSPIVLVSRDALWRAAATGVAGRRARGGVELPVAANGGSGGACGGCGDGT